MKKMLLLLLIIPLTFAVNVLGMGKEIISPKTAQMYMSKLAKQMLEETSQQLDKQLIQAAKEGNLLRVTSLLGSGANINAKEKDSGFTPLMYAIRYNYKNLVKNLLHEPGIEVNTKAGTTGLTPLMVAVQNAKDPEIVQLLLESPKLDVNAQQTSDQSTALIRLAERGPIDENVTLRIAQLLLNHPAIDVSLLDAAGNSVLQAAKIRGPELRKKLEKLIVNSGIDLATGKHKEPISSKAQKELASKLVQAVKTIDMNKIQALIKEGANPLLEDEKTKKSALNLAYDYRHPELINLLKTSPHFIKFASRYQGIPRDIKESIEPYIQYAHERNFDLLTAARRDNLPGFIRALDKGANVNTVDETLRTPLVWAIRNNNKAMIRTLLETPGIDPNISGDPQGPPLMIAIMQGDPEIVELLLKSPEVTPDPIKEAKALIELIQDDNKPTPLVVGSLQCSSNIDQELIHKYLKEDGIFSI